MTSKYSHDYEEKNQSSIFLAHSSSSLVKLKLLIKKALHGKEVFSVGNGYQLFNCSINSVARCIYFLAELVTLTHTLFRLCSNFLKLTLSSKKLMDVFSGNVNFKRDSLTLLGGHFL